MTQEEKNIKLAELDGWRVRWQHTGGGYLFDEKPNKHCWEVWLPPQRWWSSEASKAVRQSVDCEPSPPNYFKDLNAVHELEKYLTKEQAHSCGDHLANSKQDGTWASCHIWHQSAEQRCEAIGKALNLW